MSIKSNIAISDSGFLFDANTGDSYTVNKTGQVILSMIKEGADTEEIAKNIMEEYDVEKSTLMHYIDDFVNMLKRYELFEAEGE